VGCSDQACEDIICAFDTFCCAVQWDNLCATEAQNDPTCAAGCGSTPPVGCNCCDAGGTGTLGCDDPDCTNAVCAFDTFCCTVLWDNLCAQEAATTCTCCAR
jgi:hypothetical protein